MDNALVRERRLEEQLKEANKEKSNLKKENDDLVKGFHRHVGRAEGRASELRDREVAAKDAAAARKRSKDADNWCGEE